MQPNKTRVGVGIMKHTATTLIHFEKDASVKTCKSNNFFFEDNEEAGEDSENGALVELEEKRTDCSQFHGKYQCLRLKKNTI